MSTNKDVAVALATPSRSQEVAAAEFAKRVGKRRREAGAPIRSIFVSDTTVAKPALARLLSAPIGQGGGGRGGQLRVKLLLSLHWLCAGHPYGSDLPARAWAALLGLPDLETNGVRRIQQAFRELEERQFLTLETRGGHPSLATLLNESGDGTEFIPAPDAYNALKQDKTANPARHRYFRVPTQIWTHGYIADLSGPGIAMYLALLSEQRGDTTKGIWLSPSRAAERFALSGSTRRQGLDQLRKLGLATMRNQTVSERGTYIEFARRRNVYTVTELNALVPRKPAMPAVSTTTPTNVDTAAISNAEPQEWQQNLVAALANSGLITTMDIARQATMPNIATLAEALAQSWLPNVQHIQEMIGRAAAPNLQVLQEALQQVALPNVEALQRAIQQVVSAGGGALHGAIQQTQLANQEAEGEALLKVDQAL